MPMENPQYQSSQFVGPFSVNDSKIGIIKHNLDFTADASGAYDAMPADEETVYNLGANHAFYDTLEILHDVDGTDEPTNHTKRNLVLAFVAGGIVGSWVERKRIDRAFKRMGDRIKAEVRKQSGWVDYTNGGK